MATPSLVDLRNIYRRNEIETAGFAYTSIGRSDQTTDQAPSALEAVE
jgi:UDPglucose 6-dehydrogenase